MKHCVGGPVTAILDLTKALAIAGHDVLLATTDAEAWPSEPGGQGALKNFEWPRPPQLWKLAAPALPLALFSPRQLRKILGGMRGCDLVHIHGVWEPSNLQIARCARRLGIPYVVTLHGMLDDWCMGQRGLKKKAYLFLGGSRMLQGAAKILCSARGELDQAARWFDGRRGVVVPNLMDLSPYHRLAGPDGAQGTFPILANGRKNVLFLSRLHPKKGPGLLVDAAAQLRDRGVEANVLIAGAGDREFTAALRHQIAVRGVGDRVQLLGMVKSPLKESLYQACDVFALPTNQENFGFVFYEAMACGTPVITTPEVDTAAELEESGGCRLAPRTPADFATAISDLLADSPGRARMGGAGRAWVLENMDSRRITRRFEHVYLDAAATCTRASTAVGTQRTAFAP